jgi:hypothetical protein
MSRPVRPADPTRVLSLVLNLNNSGHVAIDRWGLVEKSFRVLDLHHVPAPERPHALVRLVRLSIATLRPALVVLGTSPGVGPTQSQLIQAVRRFLRGRKVRSIVRPVETVPPALLEPEDAQVRGALSQRLVEGFFPELSCHVVTGPERHAEREVYWRRAWHALGLALYEMAQHYPRQAFALSRAKVGQYYRLLARRELRHDSDPV